jgi:FkbM family methyltransferase
MGKTFMPVQRTESFNSYLNRFIMATLLQQFTDNYYLRGLPNLLYRTRFLAEKSSKVYKDPDGVLLNIDLNNYFQNNILYGYYEYAVRSLIKSRLKPGGYMLDIGGNIGYMAALGGICAGKEGRVLTFEPNPDVLPVLSANITLNKLSNVDIIGATASDKEGKARFFCGVEHALSTLVEGAGVLEIKKIIDVPVKTVDSVIAEKNIAAAEFSVVKIDVEGHEYFALKGMQTVLAAKKASFIVENNPPAQKALGVDLAMILNEFFFANNYKVYWIESKTNKSLFYKKKVTMTPITIHNVSDYLDKSGDFLAEPQR